MFIERKGLESDSLIRGRMIGEDHSENMTFELSDKKDLGV